MLSYSPSSKTKAEAELELRRRRRARQVALRALPIAEFAARTKIEVPVGANETALVPFQFWPAQCDVAALMERERLLIILKARQLGITWEACLFALRLCTLWPGQPVLALSRGQLEADELVHRISVMHHEHADQAQTLPRLVKDNTADLEWDNGSTVVSLAATKNAGRSLTAALVILDEWAFMAWPRETLAAVKPTIDAGGKLWIISSADGLGSAYHQHWQAAENGTNGYTPVFLPWTARPDRGPGWRDVKLAESGGDTTTVYREYPANAIEAFTHAAGIVYELWSDGPENGNVTEEADYVPDGGSVYWANDDGYAGAVDPSTGQFTAGSHPRVFLLLQEKSDGHLDVFAEDYRIHTELDPHLAEVLCAPLTLAEVRAAYEIPPDLVGSGLIDRLRAIRSQHPDRFYDEPTYVAADNAAATAIGILHNRGFYTRKKPTSVEESITNTRRMIAPDANGWRRIRVHPRCTRLRFEMAAYRTNDKGNPIEEHDHGPSGLRYFAWTKRLDV